MTIGIYRLYNTENNNSYIGQSKDIVRRLEQHKEDLKNNKHHCYKLQQEYNKLYKQTDKQYKTNEMYNYLDINKIVIDKFYKLEILQEFNYYNLEELLKIEDKYILKYRAIQEGYKQKTNEELRNENNELLNYTKLHYPDLHNYTHDLTMKDFEILKEEYKINNLSEEEIRSIFINNRKLLDDFMKDCFEIGIKHYKEYIDKFGEPKYIP